MESKKQEANRLAYQMFSYAMQFLMFIDYANRNYTHIMEQTRTVMCVHNGYIKDKGYLPKRIGTIKAK